MSNSEYTEDCEVHEEKADHDFRTEIPHIVAYLRLDPFQLSVYTHLKKIAGDKGNCWRKYKSLATMCVMSETKLKECIAFLRKPFKLLGGLPLIQVVPRKKPDGSFHTNLIKITPIWRANGDFCRSEAGKLAAKEGVIPGEEREIKESFTESPHDLGVGRHTTQGGSPHDYKEDISKKIPSKKDDDDACARVISKGLLDKNEFYQMAIANKRDWTTIEMESAWRKYESCCSPISDPLAYLETIILNDRVLRNNKFNKEEKKWTSTKKKTHEQNSNPRYAKLSDVILDKDLSENLLAQWECELRTNRKL